MRVVDVQDEDYELMMQLAGQQQEDPGVQALARMWILAREMDDAEFFAAIE